MRTRPINNKNTIPEALTENRWTVWTVILLVLCFFGFAFFIANAPDKDRQAQIEQYLQDLRQADQDTIRIE
jgi:preprotein translocase subunit YajC